MTKETKGFLRPEFHRFSLREWHNPDRVTIYDGIHPENMGWEFWDCPTLELVNYLDVVFSFLSKMKENGKLDFPSTVVSFSYQQKYQRITLYFIHDDSKIVFYKIWIEPQGYSVFESRHSLEAVRLLGWHCLEKNQSEKRVFYFFNSPVTYGRFFYEPQKKDAIWLDSMEEKLVSPFLGFFKERPLVVNASVLLALSQATQSFPFPEKSFNPTATLENAMKHIFSSKRITPLRVRLLGLSTDLLTCSPLELYSLLLYCVRTKSDERLSFAKGGVVTNILRQLDELWKDQNQYKD